MAISKGVKELIEKHANDINNNEFEKLIIETYLNCGAKGVLELKRIFISADIDIAPFDKAIAKIINGLLGVE